MKYFLKIICGYDDEQHHEIEAKEGHKAYYLFEHPDKRGIFDSGLAIVGKEIRVIQPDYHTTMGWNRTHNLNDDDWNELNGKGIVEKMKEIMSNAKDVATMLDKRPELANMSLDDAMKNLNEQLRID